MIDRTKERKLISWVTWFISACALVILLTSCAPVIEAQPGTATPAPSMTAQLSQRYDKPTPTPRSITCTVTAYTLNLRRAGSMSAAVIQILERGERLEVIAAGDWLKVSTAQRVTGWVYSKFCQEVNEP